MNRREFILISFFVIIFIAVRSINFSRHLNFSFDQAWSSTKALEIWRSKEITLVGPGSSLVVYGKQVLQGSVNYYFNLLFLLLGNFDPIKSSYVLMLFIAIMMFPLYYGVKWLHDIKTAIFVLTIYALAPYYIDFTRFFFGPVFQLAILPFLVFFMGLHKKTRQRRYLFCVFVASGVLLQFHYQTLIVIVILSLYYLLESKNRLQKMLIMASGVIVGYLPMIIFELKNEFYNLKVLSEYIKFAKKPSDFFFVPHRYLSISLILLLVFAPLYKRFLTGRRLIFLSLTLFILDLFLYFPTPKQAFGMSPDWNYLMEKKAYEIIKKENLKNFNIVNHIYDNKSVVIKYHLKLDNYDIDYEDYYRNRYLFVISNTDEIFQDPAYELNTFKPNKKIKQWKLNDTYNLYLFQRIRESLI